MAVGKGGLAAACLPGLALPGIPADPAIARDWLAPCCAAAAVAGHVWPLFFQFRGGKGGATLAGTLIAFSPALLVVALAAWFAAMLLFGYVGLATTVAAVAAAIGTTQLTPAAGALIACFFGVAALVAFAHRGNFARIRAGTEPREKRLWLLKPRGSER